MFRLANKTLVRVSIFSKLQTYGKILGEFLFQQLYKVDFGKNIFLEIFE